MKRDYMCSDCGHEYTIQETPQHDGVPKCPACGCTDGVPILVAATEGTTYGSWESEAN